MMNAARARAPAGAPLGPRAPLLPRSSKSPLLLLPALFAVTLSGVNLQLAAASESLPGRLVARNGDVLVLPGSTSSGGFLQTPALAVTGAAGAQAAAASAALQATVDSAGVAHINTSLPLRINGRDVLGELSALQAEVERLKEQNAARPVAEGGTVSIGTLPDLAYIGGYRSGINDNIYAIPGTAAGVLKIATAAGAPPVFSVIGQAQVGAADGSARRWYYGTAVGRYIYGAPRRATSVLIIDTLTDTVDTTSITGLGSSGTDKWSGFVHSKQTGLLYAVPFAAPSILVVNPVTYATAMLGNFAGTEKYNPAAIGQSGVLVAAPFTATTILLFDTRTNTSSTLTGFGSGTWTEAVAVGDKIFITPHSASAVIVVDSLGGSFSLIPVSTYTAGFGGAVIRGTRLYGVPHSAQEVLVVDTVLEVSLGAVKLNALEISAGQGGSAKWAGAAVGADNIIYAFPLYVDVVLLLQ